MGDKDMPKIQGHKQPLKFPFNPVHFLPYNKNYYTYDGSLTTPPCTEGLRWVVMQSNMYLSAQQLATFPFRNNFRNHSQCSDDRYTSSPSKISIFTRRSQALQVPCTSHGRL